MADVAEIASGRLDLLLEIDELDILVLLADRPRTPVVFGDSCADLIRFAPQFGRVLHVSNAIVELTVPECLAGVVFKQVVSHCQDHDPVVPVDRCGGQLLQVGQQPGDRLVDCPDQLGMVSHVSVRVPVAV